jgi:hypothetical protein
VDKIKKGDYNFLTYSCFSKVKWRLSELKEKLFLLNLNLFIQIIHFCYINFSSSLSVLSLVTNHKEYHRLNDLQTFFL